MIKPDGRDEIIGITEMAEIEHVSKQAITARMRTQLFKKYVHVLVTSRGRLVKKSEFLEYSKLRKEINAETEKIRESIKAREEA